MAEVVVTDNSSGSSDGLAGKPARAAGRRYRLVAIDMDGTLLGPDGKVSLANKAAIHRCLEAGMLVCFATGRNWTESQTVLDTVAHYASAVFVGGALVIDTKQRVLLHRTLMGPLLAAEVCAFFENQGHCALALQDSHTTGVDYLVSADLDMDASTQVWMKATRSVVHPTHGLGSHPHEHTIRVGVVAPTAEAIRLIAELKQTFGDRIVCQNMTVTGFGMDVVEVFDPAVNKWQGILHVARNHDVDPADIIAIGDDINDLPMIEHAGLGVAMGNAKPEVLAIADRVIGRNSEDGLAAFLNDLVDQHAVEPEKQS